MKILDFLNLTDEKQIDLFHDKGEFIDSIKTIDAEFQLFSLYSFYIELTYSPDISILQKFSPFTGGIRLDKYDLKLNRKPKPWD